MRSARIGAQLRLAAHRMMEAQIDSSLRHQRVERGIAGEAENVVGMVVFCPFHRLDPAVVAVAAPHDAGLRPMAAQALGHMRSCRTDQAEPHTAAPPRSCSVHSPNERWSIATPAVPRLPDSGRLRPSSKDRAAAGRGRWRPRSRKRSPTHAPSPSRTSRAGRAPDRADPASLPQAAGTPRAWRAARRWRRSCARRAPPRAARSWLMAAVAEG